jgi:hypothetical protein
VRDREAVNVAAARFWLAWTVAIEFDGEGVPPTDLVVEVHEAARELIRATKAKDLRGAYQVLNDLVLETKRCDSAAT